MVIAAVVVMKLALVGLIAIAWARSRAGRERLARLTRTGAPAPIPSPVAGYAKAVGLVLAAEAALLLVVALP